MGINRWDIYVWDVLWESSGFFCFTFEYKYEHLDQNLVKEKLTNLKNVFHLFCLCVCLAALLLLDSHRSCWLARLAMVNLWKESSISLCLAITGSQLKVGSRSILSYSQLWYSTLTPVISNSLFSRENSTKSFFFTWKSDEITWI